MNLINNKILSLLIALVLIISGCNNSTDKIQSVNEGKANTTDSGKDAKDGCACNKNDANGLASKIIRKFNQRQNELESQDARVIKLDRIEQRPNCSWIASFEISFPFGNTDGWHPSEFIKKRFICNGKEIYVE